MHHKQSPVSIYIGAELRIYINSELYRARTCSMECVGCILAWQQHVEVAKADCISSPFFSAQEELTWRLYSATKWCLQHADKGPPDVCCLFVAVAMRLQWWQGAICTEVN